MDRIRRLCLVPAVTFDFGLPAASPIRRLWRSADVQMAQIS
jgi:hypothetical protein